MTHSRCLRAASALFALLGSLSATAESVADLAQLKTMTARLAPVEIRVDVAALPDSERATLIRLIEAARYVDALYLHQVAPVAAPTLLALLADDSPLGQARLHYFVVNKGPWSELDEDKPFVPGIGERPPQANFYPPDATREEVDGWLKSLSDSERAAASGFFTAIRRTAQGKLTAVPYSVEYQSELIELARLLHEAAHLTTQPTLRSFLEKRAAAFVSNDYYESDLAWMDLDASIEPTIGPYEVYEDEWFNFKAAFEAFITLTDATESQKLARFSARAAGAREPAAHRSEIPAREARRLCADPRGQRRDIGRRWQSWRAERRLQPAER